MRCVDDRRRRWRRIKIGLLVLVLLAMINLPMLDGWLKERTLASEGVDVSATVTGHEIDEHDRYLVEYSIPPGHDLEEGPYWASLTRSEYAEAVEAGSLDVRLIPGNPVVRSVEGEVTSRLGLLLTLAANLALLLIVLGVWVLLRRRRDEEPPGPADLDSPHDPDPR